MLKEKSLNNNRFVISDIILYVLNQANYFSNFLVGISFITDKLILVYLWFYVNITPVYNTVSKCAFTMVSEALT